jgi:hypothetical protein
LSYWDGQSVSLKLSDEGKHAVAAMLGGEDEVVVFVQWADELGLWVAVDRDVSPRIAVMLVRWDHFETAMLEVPPPQPEEIRVIGFRR